MYKDSDGKVSNFSVAPKARSKNGAEIGVCARGFTLIELLVVIAIIGLLSSVVFASLQSARTKGKDAAIKAQLSNMRTAAALIYSNTVSYDTICDSGTDTYALFVSAWNNARKDPGESQCMSSGTVRFESNGTALFYSTKSATPEAWAATIYMQNGNYFCVSSTGAAIESSTRRIGGANDVNCSS